MTSSSQSVGAALASGAAVRLAFLIAHPPGGDLHSDMFVYARTARRLLGEAPLEAADALYPPGTALLLAGVMALSGRAWPFLAAGLWWAMSSLVPVLWARWAAARMSPRATALSTWLVALWPITATWTGWFLAEVPALFGILATLVLVDHVAAGVRTGAAPHERLRLVALGLVAGCTLVVRPQTALHLAIGGLPLLRAHPRVAVAAVLVSLVPLLAGAAVTSSIAGHPALLSTNAGINFYQGHCDVRFVRAGGRFVAAPVAVLQGRGVDVDAPALALGDQRVWRERGFACIRADGLAHVRRVARNVLDLGATSPPWPQARVSWLRGPIDAVNTAWATALPFVLVGGALLVRRQGRSSPALPLLLQVLAILPLAVIFYGDPRYRAMIDLFALGVVALLVDAFWSRFPASRTSD